MTPEHLKKAVDAAMVPMMASLGGAGVLGAHWLPDGNGEPVIWLSTRTEINRVELQASPWVRQQVQMLLGRLGVPWDTIAKVRIEYTSTEAEDDLLRDG